MMTDENSRSPSSGVRNPESGIHTVGIIGEGKMGTSIFYSLLDQPFSLRWTGSQRADVSAIQRQLEKKLQRSFRSGIITRDVYDSRMNSVGISSNPEDLSGCDIVIEAIPEDAGLKRKLFSELAAVTHSGCILASNSSSLNPSELYTGEDRIQDIIGIHYFYPVQLKETVELILTGMTATQVREKALGFLQQTGKQVLELNESNSFILNKLFLDIQNEGYRIVEQGKASEAQVDRLVKEHLFAIGIFEFIDDVGIDTMLSAIMNYTRNYPHREYYSGLISRLTGLVVEGKLGKKSGGGFYSYREGKEIPVDMNLPDTGTAREIVDHLRFTYLNASKRFTMLSHCTIDEMNNAVREYLGLEKGPFE